MHLHQDFEMVKQVLVDQRWMFNKIQKQENVYTESSYKRSII